MATANPLPPLTGRSRWLRRAGWTVAGVAIVALFPAWAGLQTKAMTGAAARARLACSCRYVAGRPLSNCREDFEHGMQLVLLSEDAESRTITARVPLLASQTARWRADFGCTLDPWAG